MLIVCGLGTLKNTKKNFDYHTVRPADRSVELSAMFSFSLFSKEIAILSHVLLSLLIACSCSLESRHVLFEFNQMSASEQYGKEILS